VSGAGGHISPVKMCTLHNGYFGLKWGLLKTEKDDKEAMREDKQRIQQDTTATAKHSRYWILDS